MAASKSCSSSSRISRSCLSTPHLAPTADLASGPALPARAMIGKPTYPRLARFAARPGEVVHDDSRAVTVDGKEVAMARGRMALWMTLLAIAAVVLAVIVLQATGIMFAG